MNTMSSTAVLQDPIEIFVKNGRFRVPKDFALPRSYLVLTTAPGPCLLLFQPQEWEPLRDKLLSFPLPDDPSAREKVNALRRILVGNARDVEVSARNMVEIADELATQVYIQGRLIWVPSAKGVELWSPTKFDPTRRPMIFSNPPSVSIGFAT
jgi:DNA-binding transcriptional regulator/RsmH inhibitor MraZ